MHIWKKRNTPQGIYRLMGSSIQYIYLSFRGFALYAYESIYNNSSMIDSLIG